MPLRVQPTARDAGADLQAVVKTLLEANAQMSRLAIEMAGAVASQLRETSALTTELARAAGQRARAAESEAAAATEAAREAVQLARESAEPRRDFSDRGADLLEAFVRQRVLGAPPTPAETENPQ